MLLNLVPSNKLIQVYI